MELHHEYKEKMAAQLKEWNAQISLLEAKLDGVAADMKILRMEEIRGLRARQHAAAAKMNELGKASGEAWEQIRVTADKLWDELKQGLSDVQSKFK
ncbi:MAG: hypothetical protein WBI41_10015 [Azovibrio sp.]